MVFRFFATIFLALAAAGVMVAAQAQQLAAESIVLDPRYERVASLIVSGDVSAAVALLRVLERAPPKDAGAWLDLSLLYCEAGQTDDAERVFTLIEERFSPPEAIRQLIAYSRSIGCHAPMQKKSPFKIGLTLSAGSASNVNSGPGISTLQVNDGKFIRELTLLPSSMARSDQFVAIDAKGEYRLDQLAGAYLVGGTRVRQYLHEPDFSYQIITAGAGYQKTSEFGQWDLSADLTQVRLGGAPYQNALNLQMASWLRAGTVGAAPYRLGFEVLVSPQTYPDNAAFNATLYEFRLKSQLIPSAGLTLTGYAGLVQDIGTADRLGGRRQGGMVGLVWDQVTGDAHRITLNAQRYLQRDSSPYSPVWFGSLIRRPDTSHISARYQYTLNSTQSVFLQGIYTRRDDTIPLFVTNNVQIMAGIEWRY